jgi:chaperonin GroES
MSILPWKSGKKSASKVLNGLFEAIKKDNLAVDLDDDVLNAIGDQVVKEYDLDLASRATWEEQTENAMKLAKQIKEDKSVPWDQASNVKYPLLTEAAIQFASRAMPELIKGSDIVKAEITGDDPDGSKDARAKNISVHMSWQLDKQMPEWVPDTDRALHIHPIMGGFVRKSWFSRALGRNVSELVLLQDYVVNQKANKNRLRRESHRQWYYQNDILENMRSGLWIEHDLGTGTNPDDQGEEDVGHEIIEQHCWYDLDGDRYKEPYVATVHKQTGKVLRILARFDENGIRINAKGEIVKIIPVSYFTLYEFIPDPGGGFYPLGFGQLAEPLNESINSIINQLIDSGTLANRAGGFFARGVRFKGSKLDFSPFEWKPLDVSADDLRKSIFPLPVREPSPVLFQLLGLLIQSAKDTLNIKDVLSGETRALGANASPTTIMALVEQGLKVFSGIYKRFYRSLTEEFRKLYRLNAIYLDETESFRVSGKPYQAGRVDYQEDDLEVLPVADPNMASDMQRRLQAQALLQVSGRPGVNEVEITRRYVKALHLPEEEKLLLTDGQIQGAEPPPYPKPPVPQMVIAQAKAQEGQAKVAEAGARFKLDVDKHQLELQEIQAKIENLKANTLRTLADASDIANADAMERYKAEMDRLGAEVQMKAKIAMEMTQRQAAQGAGGAPGPAGPPPGPPQAGGGPAAAGLPVGVSQ